MSISRHKTAAIIGTVTPVPHYPKKLKIYLNNASPFWQAVYWDKGKTYRKSTKVTDKYIAIQKAIEFYEQIILSKYSHTHHLAQHSIRQPNKQQDAKTRLIIDEVVQRWIERTRSRWQKVHARNVINLIDNYLLNALSGKDFKTIKQEHLLKVLTHMEKKGIVNTAHRLLRHCKSIWQYAIATGICSRDITLNLGVALQSPVYTHQHAVKVQELPLLMQTITLHKDPRDKIKCIALEIIAHTFVRTSELLGACWSEFDIENQTWKIPAERMKMGQEHNVPLTEHVISLMTYIRNEFPNSNLVFHRGPTARCLAPDALIKLLHKLGYKGRMSTHGFRAIASTVLNENGFRADAIERQLSHAERNRVRRAYNRAEYLDERKEMMAWWSNYLLNCNKVIDYKKGG